VHYTGCGVREKEEVLGALESGAFVAEQSIVQVKSQIVRHTNNGGLARDES